MCSGEIAVDESGWHVFYNESRPQKGRDTAWWVGQPQRLAQQQVGISTRDSIIPSKGLRTPERSMRKTTRLDLRNYCLGTRLSDGAS